MRRSRQALAAGSVAAALLVPAVPLAAQETAAPALPNQSPVADVVATVDGRTVTLDASKSADPDGVVVAYAWDLDGDGVHETDTGADPKVERSFPTGTALVASVRVVDDRDAIDDASATVEVAADPTAPAPEPEPAAAVARAEPRATEPEPAVTAAASQSVTITDFEFGPATVNISPGDTVTWTNRGPSIHTATANDGSFDSGNMSRGDTYSKTFSSAGTYAYICTPHPFMTGRVVVAGAGGGGGSGSGGSGGGGGSGGSDDAGDSGASDAGTGAGSSGESGGGLAKTGVDLLPWSLFGFSLFAFGAALRWRLAVE